MPGDRKAGRYDALKLIEGQFEPGSRSKVLKNLLGIKRKREIDEVEAREQLRALRELISTMTKLMFLRRLTYARFTAPG